MHLSEWLGDLRPADLLASCHSLSVVSCLAFPTCHLSDHDLKTYLSLADRCLRISEQKEKSQRVWTEELEVVEHSFVYLFIHFFVCLFTFIFLLVLEPINRGMSSFFCEAELFVVIFSSKLTYVKEFLVSSNSLPPYIAEDRVPH